MRPTYRLKRPANPKRLGQAFIESWCGILGRPTLAAFIVLTILLSLALFASQAANRTWNNTGTDFNAGASWGGTAPGSGDVAVFSTAETMQPNLSASLTIQELNFSAAG